MDELDKLSDEDLHKLYMAKQANKTPEVNQKDNLDNLSDEELHKLYLQKKSGADAGDGIKDEDIIQEMHPDIKTKILGMDTGLSYDRALAKNFANSPEAIIAYIKQEHPNLEVKNHNGQIIMKNPSEKQYRTLDPDTGFFSKDIVSDAGDVAWDVASGIPVNIAQKLGGALGMVTPIPGGTIAGAAAAGGSANAASEWMRQRLGKALGIPQEVNPEDLKLAGAIGAVSPVVFGNDLASPAVRDRIKEGIKNLPAIAQKYLAPLEEDAAKRASEGLIKRAAIGSASIASGIPSDSLREGFKSLADIKDLEASGVQDHVIAFHNKLKGILNGEKSNTWQGMSSLIKQNGEKVDLEATEKPLLGLLDEYKKLNEKLPNNIMQDKIAEVENTIKNIFGEDKPAVMEMVEDGYQYGEPKYKEVLKTPATQKIRFVDPDAAFQLKSQLSDLAEMHNTKYGIVGKTHGENIANKAISANLTAAYSALNKTLDDSMEKAGAKMGSNGVVRYTNAKGEEVAMNYAELKKRYGEVSRLQTQLATKFKDPATTYNSLRLLKGRGKDFLLNQLENADKKYGTDIVKDAKILQAYSLLSKAPTNPISGEAVTATAKTIPLAGLGAGLGYYEGSKEGGRGGGMAGAGAGAYFGSRLGSPAAMRALIEMAKAGQVPAKYIPKAAKQSAWNLMMNSNNAEKN